MGEVFAGRYELVDVLDSGGMGTVWRVWDVRDRRYRAAKMLRQSDSESLLRFVRESGTRVNHPHVLAPTGWSAEDDRVLFAMPLVTGGSVATLLADHGPLPPAWVRELMLQLLDALDAVHRAGLVHRDVKPANLLLEYTGTGAPHLRLSDFGIAIRLDQPRLTRATDVMHTPGYLAPEAAAGADPDPRHDLFAAGRVMQEMLTGVPPAPTVSPAAGSDPIWDVCLRLCADDPAHRFASAPQAREALAASSVGDDVDAEPVEVFEQVPPLPAGWSTDGPGKRVASSPTRGLPVLAIVLAVAGVMLLAAAVWTI